MCVLVLELRLTARGVVEARHATGFLPTLWPGTLLPSSSAASQSPENVARRQEVEGRHTPTSRASVMCFQAQLLNSRLPCGT